MLTPLQTVPHVQESPANEGLPVYEVIDRTASKGVRNKSALNKVCFNTPSDMPSHEGEKG